jgi:hypothetical protein
MRARDAFQFGLDWGSSIHPRKLMLCQNRHWFVWKNSSEVEFLDRQHSKIYATFKIRSWMMQ